jgi:hypothetical protein
MLPYDDEQSTNYDSENDGKGEAPLTPARPSSPPVVENAQHEPHYPWFLIGVTTPLVLQSTVAATSVSGKILTFFCSSASWVERY